MLGIDPRYTQRISDAKNQLELFLKSTNPHMDNLRKDYLNRAKNFIEEVLEMSDPKLSKHCDPIVSNRGD